MSDSKIDGLTSSEIEDINQKLESEIAKFNKATQKQDEFWKADYAEKVSEADYKNITVTLDNLTAGDSAANSLIWNMDNNDTYPAQKNDYSFGSLKNKTQEFGQHLNDQITNANINSSTQFDKYMRRTLNKAIEELSVIASMVVTEKVGEFDKSTVLIKYLRRYYGSNLSNEQYGLWSELAGHKLVPTIIGHLMLEKYHNSSGTTVDDPNFSQFAARFNSYTIKNPYPFQNFEDIFNMSNNTYSKLPTLVVSWILLQDGAYPIFEKSLEYVLKTYEYLKPSNISNHLSKLMDNKTKSEKLAIRKALATAKAKFTSILEKMDLQNEPKATQDDSVYEAEYNNNIKEIDKRIKNTNYSYIARTYLMQTKNFVLQQHSSSSATFFEKNYTLEHAIKNFDKIVDSNTSELVFNEKESILDPVNMNQVIEAYAILVDLTKGASNQIDWLPNPMPQDNDQGEPTNEDNSNGLKNQNKGDTADPKYETYESSKYTLKKNVIQKLDFVNRKLLTEYSSDNQSNRHEQLQAKYDAWVQTYNEISNSGNDEARYQTLLQTIMTEYKAVVNKDLSIL